MIVKLLAERLLELLSLKGGCRGSSESIHDKIPHCWESHALAKFLLHPCFIHAPLCVCVLVAIPLGAIG